MNYIPDKGDIVFLDFDPQSGREQSGRRPALAISPRKYNKIGLGIFCPITKQKKGYPFEVELSEKLKTKGVILSDHMKNLDWKVRNADFVEKAGKVVVEEVLENLEILLIDSCSTNSQT